MTFLANVIAFLVAHTVQVAAITTVASAVIAVENVAITTIELKERIEGDGK